MSNMKSWLDELADASLTLMRAGYPDQRGCSCRCSVCNTPGRPYSHCGISKNGCS